MQFNDICSLENVTRDLEVACNLLSCFHDFYANECDLQLEGTFEIQAAKALSYAERSSQYIAIIRATLDKLNQIQNTIEVIVANAINTHDGNGE